MYHFFFLSLKRRRRRTPLKLRREQLFCAVGAACVRSGPGSTWLTSLAKMRPSLHWSKRAVGLAGSMGSRAARWGSSARTPLMCSAKASRSSSLMECTAPAAPLTWYTCAALFAAPANWWRALPWEEAAGVDEQ